MADPQTDWEVCGERRNRAKRVAELVALREEQSLTALNHRRSRWGIFHQVIIHDWDNVNYSLFIHSTLPLRRMSLTFHSISTRCKMKDVPPRNEGKNILYPNIMSVVITWWFGSVAWHREDESVSFSFLQVSASLTPDSFIFQLCFRNQIPPKLSTRHSKRSFDYILWYVYDFQCSSLWLSSSKP